MSLESGDYRIDFYVNDDNKIRYSLYSRTRDIAGRGYEQTLIGSCDKTNENQNEIYDMFYALYKHASFSQNEKKLRETIEQLKAKEEELQKLLAETNF